MREKTLCDIPKEAHLSYNFNMKTLYLIRHAESEANKGRIFASRGAYPLTEAGKADADLIASELKEKVKIDRIISSPLTRARQTAASFEDVYSLKLEEDERLCEQELGKFSGLSYDEIEKFPDYEMDALKRWDWIPAGGGESYKMIADRISSFFRDLEKSEGDENILIVTHAVAFRLIRGVLENTLPVYPKAFPNNGEIWKVKLAKLGEVHPIESIMLGNSIDFVHNP